jgi:quercetin dioxygenase-like cupin family protein
MARTGDTLTMPDGTTFEIVESAADSDGERVEFEVTMAPGALGPPRHFHPAQEEGWTVVSGELSVQFGRKWHVLREGESRSIPPGTVHTLRNRSTEPVRFRDRHAPALDFQDYIQDLDRLRAGGRVTGRRGLRALVAFATILRAHRTTQLSASSPQPPTRVGACDRRPAPGRALRQATRDARSADPSATTKAPPASGSGEAGGPGVLRLARPVYIGSAPCVRADGLRVAA